MRTTRMGGRASPVMLAVMVAVAAVPALGEAARSRPGRAARSAVQRAEATAIGKPQDADTRLALARAYMAAGRFMSAGKTYQDVLTLSPGHAGAAIGLALMEVAVGRGDTALARLASIVNGPAADLGLARALAGDLDGAFSVLAAAARAPGADARVRQNLALVLALSGRWAEARAIASQDLPPQLVDQRLGEWAQLGGAQPGSAQVALLLHTQVVEDAGQPEALALMGKPVAVAEAAPAPPVDQARLLPAVAPLTFATGPIARPTTIAMPMRRFVFRTMDAPTSPAEKSGRYVVQFGAYSSSAGAERAWRIIGPKLRGRIPLVAGHERDGVRTLVRLSVGGFGTRDAASAVCRASGQACYVRATDGDRLASWVPAGGRQLAAR